MMTTEFNQQPQQSLSNSQEDLNDLQTKLDMCSSFVKYYQENEASAPVVALLAEQNSLLKLIHSKVRSPHQLAPLDLQEATTPSSIASVGNLGQNLSPRYLAKVNSNGSALVDNNMTTTRQRLAEEVVGFPSHLQKAFEEVYQRCDRSSYNAMYKLYKDYQTYTDQANGSRVIEQQFVKLQSDYIILKKVHEDQAKSVKLLQQKIHLLEQEKVTRSKAIAQKERQLSKQETALLVKEKMLSETKKYLKTQTEALSRRENTLTDDRRQVDRLWQQTLKQAGASQEPEGFLNGVFQKCKDSLLKQRKMLVQQQQELDKHYEAVQKLIELLKGIKPN